MNASASLWDENFKALGGELIGCDLLSAGRRSSDHAAAEAINASDWIILIRLDGLWSRGQRDYVTE